MKGHDTSTKNPVFKPSRNRTLVNYSASTVPGLNKPLSDAPRVTGMVQGTIDEPDVNDPSPAFLRNGNKLIRVGCGR